LLVQALEHRSDVRAGFVEPALPVFSEVWELGKEHVGAHEGQSVVRAQGFEPASERTAVAEPAMPLDGARADALDALEQRLTAVRSDDIAEQLAEIADIGVLGD